MKTREILIQNAADRLKQQVIQFQNEFGFQVDIDTLTDIRKSVVEQKFYQLNGKKISDYMPVSVGENAFSSEVLTYRSYVTSDDFEAGISQGSESMQTRITTSDVEIDSVKVPTRYWTNELNYTLIQLGQASLAGNWSLIEEKERARKKVWDLGLQKIAFLGMTNDSSIKGLLTQADVNSDITTITKPIKDMNEAEFQALLKNMLSSYFSNSNETAYPDKFIISNSDYLGLGESVSETYPLKSKLARLLEAARLVTDNPNFQILPLVYCQQTRNTGIIGKNRYALLRDDPDSVLFQIPIDYTTTIQDTINGFEYQGVAYGQFASVKAFRPQEMIYFDYED